MLAHGQPHPRDVARKAPDIGEAFHDVYRVDLASGKTEMVQENNGGFIPWVTEDALTVRAATRLGKTGEKTYFRPDGEGGWKPLIELSPADAMSTRIVELDESGETLYLIDSRQPDKAALAAVDMQSGQRSVLLETERADVGEVLHHPAKKPQAVSYSYGRKRWKAHDAAFKTQLEAAQLVQDGELDVVGGTLEDATWSIAFTQDEDPIRYYGFDAMTKKATFLFVQRGGLAGKMLAAMQPIIIQSRDGLDLVSYLTFPPWKAGDGNRPGERMSLIVLVRGGPWSRVSWGYNPFHRWLANHGYAMLSVSFRASTSFGKSFLNAGDKKWGRKMHRDVLDARQWAIDAGITTPGRVAIMGSSYGGYQTLVGMTACRSTPSWSNFSHLGGRTQPIENDFQDSSPRVPTGSGYFKAIVKKLCKPHPERCQETQSQG